jgi:hypothetical protein
MPALWRKRSAAGKDPILTKRGARAVRGRILERAEGVLTSAHVAIYPFCIWRMT